MIVAIHQPNYLPWLGYFAKMAQADIFVFLDDVQFSKGSYTNRVQIARNGVPAWLTLPVRHDFGAPICKIEIAKADWSESHRSALSQAYRNARHFSSVWPEIEGWLTAADCSLSDVNIGLIRRFASRLGIETRLLTSSTLGIDADVADERLAKIVGTLAPGGTYLSGAGGAKYQSDDTFRAHGLSLGYSTFKPLPYARSGEAFLPGLSIIDAVAHLGWDDTSALLPPRR